jgi:hypothetical protein
LKDAGKLLHDEERGDVASVRDVDRGDDAWGPMLRAGTGARNARSGQDEDRLARRSDSAFREASPRLSDLARVLPM